MICSCPECGYRGSFTSYIADIYSRQVSDVLAKLPQSVGMVILEYISLFRSPKRSLCWGRAFRLLTELSPQITSATVTRNGNTRNAPVAIWVQAMQQMLDQRESLSRPLKSHGYLYEVVYRLADKQAAADESAHISKLRNRGSDGAQSKASDLMPKHLKLNSLKNELESLERLIYSCPSAQLRAQADDIKMRIAELEGKE